MTEIIKNTKMIKWLAEVPIKIYKNSNVNSPSVLIRYPITTNRILCAWVIWSFKVYLKRPSHYGKILTQTTILNYNELMIEFLNSLFFTKCFILIILYSVIGHVYKNRITWHFPIYDKYSIGETRFWNVEIVVKTNFKLTDRIRY